MDVAALDEDDDSNVSSLSDDEDDDDDAVLFFGAVVGTAAVDAGIVLAVSGTAVTVADVVDGLW